jgi:hypothetical protein
MRSNPSRPSPVREELDEESYAKRARDFVLRRRIGRLTWYIYERNPECDEKGYSPHVEQICDRVEWTKPRAQLVDIARESRSFVATHSVFPHEEPVRVLSQVADICLAHVIETNIMTEEHASAILTQVSAPSHFYKIDAKLWQVIPGLYEIACRGIRYGNLEASRIFISKEGIVQLGNNFS